MIGYVCVGTNDLQRGAKYYDDLFAAMGAKRVMDFGTFIVWGRSKRDAMFALTVPYDKQPATVGNGTMVAFGVKDTATVDALYKKAMALGSKDEGPPGDRGDNYYGAYFRDLDGNKLNFHCWT